MSGGWSEQIQFPKKSLSLFKPIEQTPCLFTRTGRGSVHKGQRDCPQRLRVQGSTVWALESLQRPKWGWASRSWVLDAVASEFVDDCVILAVDVSKIFFFFEDIQIEKR